MLFKLLSPKQCILFIQTWQDTFFGKWDSILKTSILKTCLKLLTVSSGQACAHRPDDWGFVTVIFIFFSQISKSSKA